MKSADTFKNWASGGLALLASTWLRTGWQSQPKTKAKSKADEKVARVVAHCLKKPDPDDKTLLVTQWKWHTSHVGSRDLNYFTFRFTPNSEEPCSYESVAALICERFVTSYTPSSTNCQFAGRQEPMTSIVVQEDKIIHSGTSGPVTSNTSECACPKR